MAKDLLETRSLDALSQAVEALARGFAALPDAPAAPLDAAGARVLAEVAERLHDNYPYFHPLYAGQMLKPPHPVARAAAALADWINPNNHALDGGRASSRLEKEAVAQIAAMFGWPRHLGHLASGGTMANLEALWVGGRERPGRKVVASRQAHYTHERMSAVLGLPFEAIEADALGRMSLESLESVIRHGDVGTIVATMGTTATGSVDPLADILPIAQRHGVRVHADAAYGGYFTLAANLGDDARRHFDALAHVDSIVIDPHKHGLQPYGCGCVLFADPSLGRHYQHDSPYTYFSSTELHLGEITLECSRPGRAAVALWATQRLLPLVRGGEFAAMLEASRAAALALRAALASDPTFLVGFEPELDIVVWLPRAASATHASHLARRVFDEAAKRGLHLALAELPIAFFDLNGSGVAADRATVTCLRSVLMKPEHREWVPRILDILGEATTAAAHSPMKVAT